MVTARPRIGVLGLQGDFSKHEKSLGMVGADVIQVRTEEDLKDCRGLVIPGGESTTLMLLIQRGNLQEPLREFSRMNPVMGTCAGLIVLASKIRGVRMETLDLLDIEVERNGFGRQAQSFIDSVTLEMDDEEKSMEGVFIRAPRILATGEGVTTLGWWREEPVMVRSGGILALTFHPELTADHRIHRYFVKEMVVAGGRESGAA